MSEIAPYGSWASPITSETIVAQTVGLMDIALAGEDTFWIESRPEEGGRYVIVRHGSDGHISDVNPTPYNARSRVHEYGGAPFIVGDDELYFSNFADQRLYRQAFGGSPEPLTTGGAWRYADGVIDTMRQRIIGVREDHSDPNAEPQNAIVAIALAGQGRGQAEVLVDGDDFFSSPRVSCDASQLAWVSWSHPNMPWDSSCLWVAGLNAKGKPTKPVRIAGGENESVIQPEWSTDGSLYFVSDRSGWWNLYRWRDGETTSVVEVAAEFATPPWVFGDTRYGLATPDKLVCAYKKDGVSHLAQVDLNSGRIQSIGSPYTSIAYLRVARNRAVFLGASPEYPPVIVELDLPTGRLRVLRRSGELSVDPAYLSRPRTIEFPTERGLTARGFFYEPKNPDFSGPAGQRPPLLVVSHGGPTGACESTLKLAIQYWTSRGIAVLDVNYGGSSGYGRAYRQRLDGQWGVVDMEDCVNGARHLVAQGLVDGDRLAIRGNSAGGYTTLSALVFRDVFKAGASYYGVSDLEALAKDTHKFESRYLDRLIGPYPEMAAIYRQRSPISALDRLSCPVIFFQGLEDRIVPPNQAKKMVEALRAKGLPVAYLEFPEEQHGFRRAETIKRALDAELYFYGRVFGFKPADDLEPISIENLKD